MTERDPVSTQTLDEVAKLIAFGHDREAAELGAAELDAAAGRARYEGARMEPLAQLDQLRPLLAEVVGGISPEQLDNPSPCPPGM